MKSHRYRSLFGQTALLIAAALLVAQVLGFYFLLSERDRWRLRDAVTPATERFAELAHDLQKTKEPDRRFLVYQASGFDQRFILLPFDRFALRHLPRQTDLEDEVRSSLTGHGVTYRQIEASSRGFANSPLRTGFSFAAAANTALAADTYRPFAASGNAGTANRADPRDGGMRPEPRRLGAPRFLHGGQEINISALLPDGSWLEGDFYYRQPPESFIYRLGAAEVVLYAIVLGTSLFIAASLIRPLRQLEGAASRFTESGTVELLPVHGPSEVRAAIASFNAMAERVTDLLREKDHLIASIGHDLRTPLAALRIRAESIAPEADRARLIRSLDDLTRMLEDVLSFARPEDAEEAFALVDLSALAESTVEEFRELGACANFAGAPRTPVRMQQTAMKRLVRNLIENAVKFGGRADVSIDASSLEIVLNVDDYGPGIPEDQLVHVQKPFVRLEKSRNRETGGIGLGLAIASAIASRQGARLELHNRPEGGLRARVCWPLPQPEPKRART